MVIHSLCIFRRAIILTSKRFQTIQFLLYSVSSLTKNCNSFP
nr:MAG TPA: hypothetical protein [Bacteriophage sp.]